MSKESSGCHGKAENGRSAVEQPQIYRSALGQLGKMPLGNVRVAVSFPAAAAGKVLPAVLDKAHHILERIAQKNADLMRKLRRAAPVSGR